MALSDKDKFILKKLIRQLKAYRGKGTELVTVYVPAGYDLNIISQQIFEEAGTATNIKSKQTRDNVTGALEKMQQTIKSVQRTPANGLALFAGNVSEKEGGQDFQSWVIQPPMPLKQKLYQCDKIFNMEPLEHMVMTDDVYGLVVLDRRDATIAPVSYTHLTLPTIYSV